MTFDVEISLVSMVVSSDEYLQDNITEELTTILAVKKSVSRSEFYKAKQLDLQPTLVFLINPFEYTGQEYLYFEDKKYKILKTYKKDLLELTCERVIISD